MSHHPDPADLSWRLRAVVHDLTRRLTVEGTATNELSRPQETVLARLHQRPGMTSADLARLEGVSPQSMSAIIGALVAGGHVLATPSAEDGRRRELQLTDSGRDLIAAVRSRKTDWVRDRIESQLNAAEQAELASAIALLSRLVDIH